MLPKELFPTIEIAAVVSPIARGQHYSLLAKKSAEQVRSVDRGFIRNFGAPQKQRTGLTAASLSVETAVLGTAQTGQ